MTWYQHKNYGTTLQAMALQKVIKSLGYDAFGINYLSKGYDRETFFEKITSFSRIKEGIYNRVQQNRYGCIIDQEKESRYNYFIARHIAMFPKTQTASQLFKLNEVFDAFVCGSDQIWSPNEFNSKYYLDFVEDDNKKIAYGPSFGISEVKNEVVKKKIGGLISSIKHLSVRENQSVSMIKKYYGIDAQMVLDPTLLLEKTEWESFRNSDYEVPSNYLLCYFLGQNEGSWKQVRKIAREKNLEILIIPVHAKDYTRSGKVLKGVGPAEFLQLFSKASFVCTDSFHGTVFSVIFGREFCTFKRFRDSNPRSQNLRVVDLLNNLNLMSQLSHIDSKGNEINWEKTYTLLNTLKNDSMKFLRESLATATFSKRSLNLKITNSCCGCGVCLQVCKQDAIIMDFCNGFYTAKVDSNKCINCGLCKKVCGFNGENGRELRDAKLYESKSLNLNTLCKSTSGGIAHELLVFALENRLPVYACEYDFINDIAVHTMTKPSDMHVVKKYQGSKYLQSNFFNNLQDIISEKKGVIIGTPCQIAGIANLLDQKRIREHYLLIDLICHGVPTSNLWKRYLEYQGVLGKLEEVRFRNPESGWRDKSIYLRSASKEIQRKEMKDLFYSYFDLQVCYCASCFECNYRESSKADIRLGDYWGKKYTEDDLKNGVSMVVVFSNKGKQVLTSLFSNRRISLKETNMDDYYCGQSPQNPIIPIFYDEILEELEKGNLDLREIRRKLFKKKYYNQQLQLIWAKFKRR